MGFRFIAVMLALGFVPCVCVAQVPSGAICVEAEEYMVSDPALSAAESIFSSGGLYVSIAPEAVADRRQADVIELDIPESHDSYTLWVRCAGVNLGCAKGEGDFAWHDTQRADWAWHNLGPVTPDGKQLTIAVASPLSPNLGTYAVDCLLFTPDASFTPSGIYRSVLGPGEEPPVPAPPSSEAAAQPVNVTITAQPDGPRVSRYLASANCHGAARHCPDLAAWDDTMERFFAGNLLVVLESARREPDADGLWWNFAPIDEFIRKAKDVWRVEDLVFLPQWWIEGWDRKSDPTEEQFAKSSEALSQLVERYGMPGPLFVKYWMCCDEWPGLTYWQEHPESFARHYGRLVEMVKSVNPDLLVGGPVDCYPNSAIIRALLRECPMLDFIAWNLFVTNRGDYPLPQLFARTSALKKQVEASRELSREILGKELPVMVSSYHANFRAWDPPDIRLTTPAIGVWNALALVYLGQGQAFSGVIYNVRSFDCGLFGPEDTYAVRAGVQSDALPGDAVNVRPLARVHDFVNRRIAGQRMSDVQQDDLQAGIEVLATFDEGEGHAVVIVNATGTPREVHVALTPFAMAPYAGFELPSEFLYCDQNTVTAGNGLFFASDGKAILNMPGISAWCLHVPAPEQATPAGAREAQ